MATLKDGIETADKALDTAKKGADIIEKLLSVNPTYRANKMLLDEIEHDPNMSAAEKAIIMYNLKKIKRELKNKTNIYNCADLILNNNGKSLEQMLPTVDDEWLGMYDDISKNVSDKDMQAVWAKILASKCEDEHSVSKRLLQVLQAMDSKDAELFSYLCSHSVMGLNPEEGDEYPIFFYPNYRKNELDFYDEKYVNYANLSNFASLGLINYNTSIITTLYERANRMFISYYGEKICVYSNNKEVDIGVIIYTACGAELVKILHSGMEHSKDPLLLTKISDYYQKKNYTVEK
ncbi:MAG: DUF2806 domain-containing protein [Oscillospiraceae bacterium]